ncbi:hypothetical protein OAN27_02845 [Pelagibacteraceae bacterium]|nr:hypothetical protein [Pelagibacteraceae bacterium]
MKKIIKKNDTFIRWFIWLLFIFAWNFGFPEATPVEDVIVAIILSLVFTVIKNQKK